MQKMTSQEKLRQGMWAWRVQKNTLQSSVSLDLASESLNFAHELALPQVFGMKEIA